MDEKIEHISKKAMYMTERIGSTKSVERENKRASFDEFMKHLSFLCAKGSEDNLRKMLKWSGYSVEDVNQAWELEPELDTELAKRMSAMYHGLIGDRGIPAWLEGGVFRGEYPFEKAYSGLAILGLSRLRGRLENKYEEWCSIIENGAKQDLVEELVRRLTNLGKYTLYKIFSENRTKGEKVAISLMEEFDGAQKRRYRKFVKDLKKGRWEEVFEEYPVLLRLMAVRLEQWVRWSEDFISRTIRDRDLIRQRLISDEKVKISGIDFLGDIHKGGRTKVISFCDEKVVYKPKITRNQKIFKRLKEWLNKQLEYELKSPKTLQMDGYKWVEYIEQKECESIEEVRKYYIRSGQILSILYILGSVDIHQENWIACGEHPVLVDYETILHGTNKYIGDIYDFPNKKSYNDYKSSVLSTGVLPVLAEDDSNASLREIGALVGSSSKKIRKSVHFVAKNTDFIHLKEVKKELSQKNELIYKNNIQPATKWTNEIVKGVDNGLEKIYENKNKVKSLIEDLIISEKSRFIFRPTRTYKNILKKSTKPKCLKNGLMFESYLMKTVRPYLNSSKKPRIWPLHQREVKNLKHFNIPLFITHNNKRNIHNEGSEISNVIDVKPIKSFNTRIESLSPEKISLQKKITEESIRARKLSTERDFLLKGGETANNLCNTKEVSLNSEVKRIKKYIIERSFAADDQSRGWIDIQPLNRSASSYFYGPLGPGFYKGVSGIAFFLAAEDYVNKNTSNKQVVHQVVSSLRNDIIRMLEHKDHNQNLFGMGGITGVGSYIYLFSYLAKFYHEEEYLDVAIKVANHLTEGIIQEDRQFDLVSGAAGTLRAVLSSYRLHGDTDLLETADLCAMHLLRYQHPSPSNGGAWTTLGGRQLIGMAHGAAGIALSLADAASIIGRSEYSDAVSKALEYIISEYDPTVSNWPDYRNLDQAADPKNKDAFQLRWCVGAPGVIRSLYEIKEKFNYPVEERYILEPTSQIIDIDEKSSIDHLCCGNIGRYMVLESLDSYFSKNNFEYEASKLLKKLVSNRLDNNGYIFFHNESDLKPVTFMQGISGIGYSLLWFENQSALPDITIIE